MEWVGLLCLAVLLMYSAYPGKVRKLEKKVKKLESKLRGEEMSKLFENLVGKKCRIMMEDGTLLSQTANIFCDVLDVDEEWMKVAYEHPKKGKITKLIRIDSIDHIEEIEGA